MTNKTDVLPTPGTLIHVVEDGLMVFSEIFNRGNEITLSAKMIEQTVDRNGNSWLALVDDEEAQVQRWGHVMVRRGPFPEGETLWRHGDARWTTAREEARKAAWALGTETQQKEALRQVESDFGPSRTSSQTISAQGPRR